MSSQKTPIVIGFVLSLLVAAGCGAPEDPLGGAKIDLKNGRFTKAIERLRAAPVDIRESYAAQMVLAEAYVGAGDLENAVKAYDKAAVLEPQRHEPLLGSARTEGARARSAVTDSDRATFQLRAIERCLQAVKLNEKCAEAYTMLGELRASRREIEGPEGARAAYKKAVEVDPADPERKLNLARLHIALREDGDASALIEQALKQDPALGSARLLRAQLLQQAGQLEEAKEELQQTLDPKNAKGLDGDQRAFATLRLAQLCLATGEADRAKTLADQLKRHRLYHAEARFIIGSVYAQDRRWKEAYDELKVLVREDSPETLRALNPAVVMRLAAAEQELGMENIAIGHYQLIVEKIDPKYVMAHLNLAELLFRRAMYDEAMKHCNAVLRERPDHPGALFIRAQIHRAPSGKHHNLELARACYLRILSRNRTSALANLELARVLLQMGQPVQAMEYAQVAGAEQDTAEVRLVLGRAKLMLHHAGASDPAQANRNYLALAIDDLKLAKTLDPKNGEVAESLARAYVSAEKPEEAVAMLKRFLSVNPAAGRGYLLLAWVYETMKQPHEAIATLEAASKVTDINGFEPSAVGRAYFLGGRRKDAIATWQKLVAQEAYRTNLGVNIALAVSQSLEDEYGPALTYADTVAHQASENVAGPLVAACVYIRAAHSEANPQKKAELLEKARLFLEGVKHPSPKERTVYVEFPAVCRDAGENGRKAAALLAEGILHLEFQSPETAISRLAEATKVLPQSVIPHYILGHAMLRAGRMRDYISVYRNIFKLFQERGYPHFDLAMRAGRVLEAAAVRQHLETAIDHDNGLAPAFVALAQLLLRDAQADPQLSTIEAAVKRAAEAVRLDGGTMASLDIAANAQSVLAQYYQQEIIKEQDAARRDQLRTQADQAAETARGILRQLREKYPQSVEAAKAEIRFELIQRNYARAAGLATGLLKDPERQGDRDLHLLAAQAFAEQGGDKLDDARRHLEQLLRVDYRNAAAYRLLAIIYLRTGRPDLAIAVLDRALRLSQALPVAFDLANAFLKYGHVARARDVYQSIIDFIPAQERQKRAAAIYATALLGKAEAISLLPAKDEAEKNANLYRAEETLKDLTAPPGGGQPDARALVLLGRIMEALNRDLKAIELYKQCIEAFPKYAAAYQALALIYFRRAQYQDAVRLYTDRIIPTWPFDLGAHGRLAIVYLARGTPADNLNALATTAKIIEFVDRRAQTATALPDALESYYRHVRVLALMANDKFAEARAEVKKMRGIEDATLETCQQIIEECSRDAEKSRQWIALQGAALFYMGSRQEVLGREALAKASELFPGNLFVLSQRAGLYKNADDLPNYIAMLEEQITAAERAGVAVPRLYHERLYTSLVDTCLQRLTTKDRDNALEKAYSFCTRGLERWGDSTDLLERLAAVHMARDQATDAIRQYQKVISILPQGTEGWIKAKKQQALAYHVLGNPGKAAEACADIERYIETDATWLNNFAWFLATSPQRDLARATKLAERAKELAPMNPTVRDTLGWIYHLDGKHFKALPELEYAAQELGSDASVAYHLGVVLVQIEEPEKALPHLRRAMDLYRKGAPFPDAKDCQTLIERLQKRVGSRTKPGPADTSAPAEGGG